MVKGRYNGEHHRGKSCSSSIINTYKHSKETQKTDMSKQLSKRAELQSIDRKRGGGGVELLPYESHARIPEVANLSFTLQKDLSVVS